jgi:hypothetical protein
MFTDPALVDRFGGKLVARVDRKLKLWVVLQK